MENEKDEKQVIIEVDKRIIREEEIINQGLCVTWNHLC